MRVIPQAFISVASFPFKNGPILSTVTERSLHSHWRASVRQTVARKLKMPISIHSAGERPVDPTSLSSSLPNNVSKVRW